MVDEANDAQAGLPEISEQELQDILASADKKMTAQLDEFIAETAELILKKDVLPVRALSIPPETMEGVYAHAYNLYNRGLYSEGAHIFQLLIMLDIRQEKYYMGMAACLHMEKRFEDAAQMYILAAAMAPGNPLPYHHAADCYVQMNKPTAAREVLGYVMDMAGDQPEYAVLAERAKLMYDGLQEASDKEESEET